MGATATTSICVHLGLVGYSGLVGVVFSINSSEAEQLDKSGKLKFLLVEKIKEGLKVVGLDGKEILKKL